MTIQIDNQVLDRNPKKSLRNLKTDARLCKKSIQHWEDMRDNPGIDNAPTASRCSLCDKYSFLEGTALRACEGCPVALKSGYKHCISTPYYPAYTAWCEMVNANELEPKGRTLRTWVKCANEEIDFLKQILAEIEKRILEHQETGKR